ncbi:hypothetical protein [Gordonibacter sp. 28C]|uniref:hypothetical protein n=1 Tax=Gordonibacter sp. 28C TaxID=2078569 RepID=UPI001314494F|nr:hypothetical protein [Gordonibacter sp. 28C]
MIIYEIDDGERRLFKAWTTKDWATMKVTSLTLKLLLISLLALGFSPALASCSSSNTVSSAPTARESGSDTPGVSKKTEDQQTISPREQLVSKKLRYSDQSNSPSTTFYAYDENNQIVSEETSTAFQQWEYDLDGRVLSWSSAKSKDEPVDEAKYYLYDDSGYLAEKIQEGAELAWIGWTPAMMQYSHRTTFEYDKPSDVLTITGYGAEGQLVGTAKTYYDGGREWNGLSVDFDAGDSPARIEVFDPSGSLAFQRTRQYNDSGNLIELTDYFVQSESTIDTTFCYDSSGNCTSKYQSYSNDGPILTKMTGTYTADGKPLQIMTLTKVDGETDQSLDIQTFAYDSLGRLASEIKSSGYLNSFDPRFTYETYEYVENSKSAEAPALPDFFQNLKNKFAIGKWETVDMQNGEPLVSIELFEDGTGTFNGILGTWENGGSECLTCTIENRVQYIISFNGNSPTISGSASEGVPIVASSLQRELDEEGYPLIAF